MGRVWMRLSCGVGSLFNEFWRQMALSFGLVFYTKVIGLSSRQAGLILAVGQVTAVISTIIFGYLCDKVDVPFLSARLGRKKTWHLFSNILLAPFLLMAFSRCFACTDSTSTWTKFAYFLFGYGGATFMYGATEMAHLSLIPIISESQDEAIILNSLRTGFSYIAGILTYAVAWATLGQSSQKTLSSSNWKEFSITAATLVVAGLFFAAFFQIGTKELKEKNTRRTSTVVISAGFNSVAMAFGLSTDEPKKDASRKSSKERKTSRLRKLSEYIMPYEFDSLVGPLDNMPVSSCQPVSSDEESSSMKKFSAGKRPEPVSLPDLDVISEEHTEEEEKHEEEEVNDSTKADVAKQPSDGGPQYNLKTNSEEDKSSRSKQRRPPVWQKPSLAPLSGIGTESSPEDVRELDELGAERKRSQMKISFSDSPVFIEVTNREKAIEDMFQRKEDAIEFRTWKSWLKYRALYKVAFVYVTARLLENITYSYLALYLVDHLQYPKEAITYFPMTLFVSAVFGTAIAKKLNKTIGKKWTYLVFSTSTIGGAVSFYFVNESSRDVTYAPTVLIGCGMSGLTVMALTFVTAMIGKYKESAGFVYSLMSTVFKLLTAIFIMVVQNFYPTDKEDRQTYIRHVFALSLGMVALLPALVVLFFQQSEMVCLCVSRDSCKANIRHFRDDLKDGLPSTTEDNYGFDTCL